MLAYTLQRTLTQQAVIERDLSEPDAYGADDAAGPDWREHATVPCRMWWDKASARSPSREYVTAQRVVPLQLGGMLVELGSDVSEDDRIARILDRSGELAVDGVFEILAVTRHDTHMELAIQRAHLGA